MRQSQRKQEHCAELFEATVARQQVAAPQHRTMSSNRVEAHVRPVKQYLGHYSGALLAIIVPFSRYTAPKQRDS